MIPNCVELGSALVGGILAQAAAPIPAHQDTVLDMVVGSGPVVRAGLENVQRAMARARTQEVTSLERGLTFLATTASTAPFIGLFGTVWGIMTAFRGLSVTTSSSIQAVAPGIAEALVATAVGLVAAIPAVVMYNRFARPVPWLTARTC